MVLHWEPDLDAVHTGLEVKSRIMYKVFIFDTGELKESFFVLFIF